MCKKKLTQEQANERVSKKCLEKNATFEPFVYVDKYTIIYLNCNVEGCNHRWSSTYRIITTGDRGCGKCCGNIKYTQDEVNENVSKICLEKHYTFEPFVYGGIKKTNINLTCNVEGCNHKWTTDYSRLLVGNGCPKCSGNIKLTQDEAVERVTKKSLEKNYTFEPFIYLGNNKKTRINLNCNVEDCNHKWSSTFGKISKGCGCPKCFDKKRGASQKLSQDEAVERVTKRGLEINFTFDPFVYIGSNKTRINFTCNVEGCNHKWTTSYDIITNCGCPKCARTKHIITPYHMLSDCKKYSWDVDKETRKNKKKLLESWDGVDFYDKEYIKDNFNLHYNDPKYPTIDHRNPVVYCFLNGVPAEICASLDNLCMTKRGLNSSKNKQTEDQYRNKKGLI